MIDLEDKKHIVLKSGRKILRYHCYCNNCGADRGYKNKNKANSLCYSCANKDIADRHHKGKKLSKEIREKMSKSAYSRKPSVKKEKREHNSWRTYKVYNTSLQRKLKHNIKGLLNVKLKRHNLNKNYKSIRDILPYTIEELIKHLESQFQDGMSWGNYGKDGWHIDHKIPDSWFNYESLEDNDFFKSWSLDNLQPMWAKDNLSKGNRYIK